MHVHFIGIGGIGMSGLARIMLASGHKVSGSDIRKSPLTEKICSEGAIIYKGHHASQIKGADLVVFSSAISAENPEIMEAKSTGIPLISRGKLVAQIANSKKAIVVAGTHGKTTTTALISELFLNQDIDLTILIGGILKKINANSRFGIDRWMLVESDESDASFLHLHPHIAVITNVENDHLDYYGSPRNLINAFTTFMEKVKPGGGIIANLDDPGVNFILKKNSTKKRMITYGLQQRADISAIDINTQPLKSSFKVSYRGNFISEVEVPLPGVHNIYNCLATIGTGLAAGISWEKIRKTLHCFGGVKRRLEKIGQVRNALVYDDYAHHPTEIKATLHEVHKLDRRIIAIFQPHRYTRTKSLLHKFPSALKEADLLILTDIYSAGESPVSGINGEVLFDIIRKERRLPTYYIPHKREIIEFVKHQLKERDLVITIGAGDVTDLSYEIVGELRKNEKSI